MTDTESEPEKRTKSRWGCGCLGLLLLFVGYILSPGPFSVIYEKLPLGVQNTIDPVWDIYFGPIEWCYDRSSTVESFYDWYGELFDF